MKLKSLMLLAVVALLPIFAEDAPPKEVGGLPLFLALKQLAPDGVEPIILDRTYAVLAEDAPAKLFHQWLRAGWLSGLMKWNESISDCDKFSFVYRTWCQLRHNNTDGQTAAFPVGIIGYYSERLKVKHVIAFHLVDDGSGQTVEEGVYSLPGVEIVFVDPLYWMGVVELTETELQSIRFVIL